MNYKSFLSVIMRKHFVATLISPQLKSNVKN